MINVSLSQHCTALRTRAPLYFISQTVNKVWTTRLHVFPVVRKFRLRYLGHGRRHLVTADLSHVGIKQLITNLQIRIMMSVIRTTVNNRIRL